MILEFGIWSKNVPYPVRQWSEYFDPWYGNCFTFNSAYKSKDFEPRTASMPGIWEGLTVEIFLDQDNYMRNRLSKNAGARNGIFQI
jgi:hypothetical protein